MTGKNVQLSEPTSIWNRDVRVDIKPFFLALGKGVVHAATLKADDFGADMVEAAASLGLDAPVSELAFILIKRATFATLLSLTRESLSHINAGSLEEDGISQSCMDLLANLSVNLDARFFANPSAQPFVRETAEIYRAWLLDKGVISSSAQSISNRYPAYFTYALGSEWRKNAAKYKPLLTIDGGPFARAEANENAWELYFSFLKKRVSESVFDEPFGLRDIYVPINAYYLLPRESRGRQLEAFESRQKRVCVRLHEEIKRWLEAGDKADAIRVVSGGPGSGKSSFTKMLCCDLAESGVARPIYIPLHLIDPTRDVAQEVERFIKDEGLISFNPLDQEQKQDHLLLIFDGLDELASTGKVAAQVARDFVQAVERMVERRNLGPHPLYVLLSGRELIVQENETEFRQPKQILTILPYHVTDDKECYVDKDKLLSDDLRNNWWTNYGQLTGRAFDGLPPELALDELDEITSQPLLNYLVALSYLRGHLDFSKVINLNSVYADLVAAVHERAYENSRTFRPISHLKLSEFVRVLEEIGLAAWHGSDGRSTSVRDIMAHCTQSGLESLLTSFKEGAQAGVTKLLAAFFFRRNGESVGDDAAFVFTHKSFGEYLTSCRIVRALERIVSERRRRRSSADEGFDINEAFVYWLKIAGPAQMTEYLKTFLERELLRRPDINLEDWQSVLQELMAFAINGSIPVDRLGSLPFATASRYEVNASTALLIALNACSSIRLQVSTIPFASETSFGTFLRRVCPQRSGPQSPLIYSALSYLDLSGQCMDMIDLYGANLSGTKWNGCTAHFANFGRASFYKAEMRGCQMRWSRFDSAEFTETEVVETDFGSTVWDSAHIRDSIFSGVDLQSADFSSALIFDSRFAKTIFAYASLDSCREVRNSFFIEVELSNDDRELMRWFSSLKASDEDRVDFKVKPREELNLLASRLRRRRSSKLVKRAPRR